MTGGKCPGGICPWGKCLGCICPRVMSKNQSTDKREQCDGDIK